MVVCKKVSEKLFQRHPHQQCGASMVEFLIVTPLLLFIGMGIVQFGLIYHAKSMLNYATFEAARAGAVSHAQIDIMRKELGYRMAPVYGGDGTLRDGANAILRSAVAASDPTSTKIEILNPTVVSFSEHGKSGNVIDSHGNNRTVIAIPNSHLGVRDHNIIKADGLNVQDANLLKIRVTFGYQMRLPFLDMEVPGMRLAMRTFMMKTDPENWMYYVRGMLPIQATATVRMQSEAWDSQLDPPAIKVFDAMYNWTIEQIGLQSNDNPEHTDETGPTDPSDALDECDENGLANNTVVENLHKDTECLQDELIETAIKADKPC